MIDTDKYEGMTYNNDYKMGIELEIAVGNLLAEVKRLREGIEQALEAMSCHTNHSVYNSSWNILKELIE